MSSKDTLKSFTEPGALSSTASADLPLPRRALRDRFDLLASRARCRRDPRGQYPEAQAGDDAVFAKCGQKLVRRSREPPEQHAEERVPPRCLQVGARVGEKRRDAALPAGGMAAVDEVAEWVEEGVLGEREPEREAARARANAAAQLVEDEAEERAVDRVQGEAGGA